MTPEELLMHRELELLRAAGRIRKHGNNRAARARTKERSSKVAQIQGFIQREVKRKMEGTIRAKFKCSQVTKMESHTPSKGEFVYCAKLYPVTNGSPENQAFYAATPAGSIELSSYVSDKFEPGKEYFVDFSTAE